MPRTITASDRSALIRLASTMPSGSADRRDLLRFIVASTPLEEQEFKHPETGNKVKFTSLPKEEQAKIRAKMKDKGGDDKGIAKKLSGWMDKAKGLTDAAKKKIQSLPDDAKKFVADPDYRKEVTSGAAKAMKEAPKKYAKKVIHHFEHEIEEVGGALKNIKSGKPPSKKQMKAIAGIAVEVGVAALSIKTGGMAGAGVTLAKGLAKHAALSALSGKLGDAYVFGYGGSHLIKGVMSIVAAEDEPKMPDKKPKSDDPEQFVEDLILAIADEMEKGMSDEAVVKALNESSK